MDDIISGQAAFDAITDELMPSTPLSAVIRAKNRLKDLPTVQPDHVADIGKKVEGDCISRQAVVKFFNDWISCLDENCHHQSVADMIIIKNDFKNLPSVQPGPKWIPYKRPDLSEEERIICKQYLEDLDRHRSCNEYKILVGMLDAPTLGTWIPCGERLPEYNESVLTWDGYVFRIEKRIPYIRDDDGEPIEGDWWVSDEYDEYESEFYPNLRDGAAIAWMSLPEPYMKEGDQ